MRDASDGAVDIDASDGAVAMDANDGAAETGVEEAGSEVDAADGHVDGVLSVEAIYSSAPRWGDYVVDAEPLDSLSAADLGSDAAACASTTATLTANSCVHGGSLRQLRLPEEESCEGLVASDERDWFEWACHDTEGGVVFHTHSLSDGVTLEDLLDFSERTQPRWRENAVTVMRGEETIARTQQRAFWDNPVVAIGSDAPVGGHRLDVEGTVYVLTAELNEDLHVVADHVSLIAMDDVLVGNQLSRTAPLVDAQGVAFLWLEGLNVDATGRNTGVDLDVVFSTVQHVQVSRFGGGSTDGVDLRVGASSSTLQQLKSNDAAGTGIEISGRGNAVRTLFTANAGRDGIVLRADNTTYEDVIAEGSGRTGVYATFDASTLSNAVVERSGARGVWIQGSLGCHFSIVKVANSGATGFTIEADPISTDEAQLDTVVDLVSTNNDGAGIVLRGTAHTANRLIAAANEGAGLEISGNGNVAMHVTVANNRAAGVLLDAADGAHLVNVVTINNGDGIDIVATSEHTRVRDLVAVHNSMDLRVSGHRTQFAGDLMLTALDTCAVSPMAEEPGFAVGPPCQVVTPSTATLSVQSMLANAFVGLLSVPDPINAHAAALDASATLDYGSLTDWTNLSARQRHWGRFSQDAFPGVALRGRCGPSDRCAVWDWRVSMPSVLRERFSDPVNVPELNDPVHQAVHQWRGVDATRCAAIEDARWDGSACTTAFLDYALQDDNAGTRGNRNGICEPLEGCLLNRHRGAYAGQGPTEGVLQVLPDFGGVYLQRYAQGTP